MSNYPPGVTGNEPQIAGVEYEVEGPCPYDFVYEPHRDEESTCDGCDGLIDHGEVTWQASGESLWWLCPVCGAQNEVDPDVWDAMQSARARRARRRGRTMTGYPAQESTQALMQRTDPVGYQQCRDAGRF